MKLDIAYYQDEDVVKLTRSFLGMVLVTKVNGMLTSGLITETEAYAGINDKASHAYGNKHTQRTDPMYEAGGIAYVYLIYGMYSLFNIVSAPKGTPHAILIRAIEPLEGLSIMEERRQMKINKGFSDGPGKLTIALGIHYSDSGESLHGDKIWIEDRKIDIGKRKIIVGPRVGIDYAEEDALKPYRFLMI